MRDVNVLCMCWLLYRVSKNQQAFLHSTWESLCQGSHSSFFLVPSSINTGSSDDFYSSISGSDESSSESGSESGKFVGQGLDGAVFPLAWDGHFSTRASFIATETVCPFPSCIFIIM